MREVPIDGGLSALTAGPDGAVWVTLGDVGEVARGTVSGEVTRFAVGERPRQIVAGPDGALWFTLAGAVGRLTVTGELSTVEAERPDGICVGPDRRVWFTDVDRVCRLGSESFPVPGGPGS